ncbi:ATP-binding cassette domain-containing protein [Pseudidiomarina sp. 1ASP75-14]|uniref:ATP-binding cassette domain-containing protein n=1 Tax=Pseudidiomarina terrestris TaxID=2820060 RepID=UPI00264F1746|nr:ATP-binding cassette domain-containing protein [Pseudidiomarina sp. 1ASP75-14]MDN7138685.1 ATP-binding cassette domain-containing protein [Pseudidiomarina sp. 1ASP75-14]
MNASRSDNLLRQQMLRWRDTDKVIRLPDMSIAPGESLGMMGPSGCGKSTWLRALLGESIGYARFTGELWVAGKEVSDLPIEQRGIGILLQDNPLFPHYSVRKNLAFALQRQGLSRAQQTAEIEQQLEAVGMAAAIDRLPGQLSGGQRARIGLLRTVMAAPALVLLDEPFSALDAERRVQVRDWTLAFLQQRGIASIIVSHDAEDLAAVTQQFKWPKEQN